MCLKKTNLYRKGTGDLMQMMTRTHNLLNK